MNLFAFDYQKYPESGRVCRKLTMNQVYFLRDEFLSFEKYYENTEVFWAVIKTVHRQVDDQTATDLDHKVNCWMSPIEFSALCFLQNHVCNDLLTEISIDNSLEVRKGVSEVLMKRYAMATSVYLQLKGE